jgi:hypothetical protein
MLTSLWQGLRRELELMAGKQRMGRIIETATIFYRLQMGEENTVVFTVLPSSAF